MYWMKNQSRQENLLYLAVWGLLFAAPLISQGVRSVNEAETVFNWHEVLMVWDRFGVFLLLFLLHNFLLAPLLIHQHRRVLYTTLTILLITGYMVFQYQYDPRYMGFGRPPMEQRGPYPMDMRGPHPMDQHEPPGMPQPEAPDDRTPRHELRQEHEMRQGHEMRARRHHFGERDIMGGVMLLLMLAANLGAKLYFRSSNDRRKLEQLEKQNLEQQLEYLKYQINPHFFMNTLNNIHALVDINPAKAQDTILELSKMMRFVLYEGDKSGVPLTKEFEFIRNYTRLMQLRYTDKVKISVDLPTEAPDKTVPPLMLITFIENAFKHGVSYQHDSFINIKLTIGNNHLYFDCQNSKAERLHIENAQGVNGTSEKKGGVGLANVRKRLDLLYDKRYTLDIKDEPDIYTVKLILPL